MLLATFMLTAAHVAKTIRLRTDKNRPLPKKMTGKKVMKETTKKAKMWKEATADTSSSIVPVLAIPSVWRRPSSPHWIAI